MRLHYIYVGTAESPKAEIFGVADDVPKALGIVEELLSERAFAEIHISSSDVQELE